MRLYSETKTNKILVNIESKREYVLRNSDFPEDNLLKAARFGDNLLKYLDEMYDDIILNKGLKKSLLRDKLDKVDDLVKRTREELEKR